MRSSNRFGVFAWLFCAVLAMGFAAGPTNAQQAAVPEALAKKLDQKIRVQFLDTPAARALEAIQRDSGLPFIVDRQNLVHELEKRVTLDVPEMTVRAALNWVCRFAQADWDVRDGAILISSRREVIQPYLVVRVYDVRGLTTAIPDFDGPDSLSLDRSLSNTSSGGSGFDEPTYREPEAGLFGEAPSVKKQPDVAGLSAERLVAFIRDHVSDYEDWSSNATELGVSIKQDNGLLIVVHTEKVQQQVQTLLDELAKPHGRMVGLEAQFVLVPSELLQQALDEAGSMILDAGAFKKLAAKIGTGNANVRLIAGARTVCMNHQFIHMLAGNEATFLSDIEPVSETGGVDVTLSSVHRQAVINLRPTIRYDEKGISLTIISDVVTGGSMRTTPVPVGGMQDHVRINSTGSVQGSGDDANRSVNVSGKLKGAGSENAGIAHLEMPDNDIVRYRTTLRVPDGGGAVLTGYSAQFKHAAREGHEVVLLLRASIVR